MVFLKRGKNFTKNHDRVLTHPYENYKYDYDLTDRQMKLKSNFIEKVHQRTAS